MKHYKTVSIIIPVFNEERFIKQVVEEVIQADTLGLKKEIIVVNDGSQDRTGVILNKIRRKYSRLVVINHPTNLGKGAAVKSGLMRSGGDVVLIQDADLEYSPTDYPALLEPITDNRADVVYGSRFISDKPHRVLYFWHYQVNKWLTTLSNVFTNLNLTDMETGFKAFRGQLVRDLAPSLKSQRFGFEPEITAKLAKQKGLRIYEIGIAYSGRTYAEGKKINWWDGVKAVGAVIRYNLFK